VLSDFARRIGGTYAAEEVLPRMSQIVAAGTGAETVVVWLRVGDEFRPEASSDASPLPPGLPVAGQALPAVPGSDLNVPIVHQGELLGAISVTMPKDEPLRPAGQQLVADMASQAGLALANAGLIEDLRASRQRLVTAQDEARRRLERRAPSRPRCQRRPLASAGHRSAHLPAADWHGWRSDDQQALVAATVTNDGTERPARRHATASEAAGTARRPAGPAPVG
jgi:hypothetical protein